MGNNWLGWQVCRWLLERGERIVGAALHPEKKRKYCNEILTNLPSNVPVFQGNRLKNPETINKVKSLNPDIGISILFDYILKGSFINIFPERCINLHPAYLPFNRGQYPNVWSIVEGTLAGTTLHYIDEGIDTGNIIAQKEVQVEPVDTGESLYKKLEQASLELFKEAWPNILENRVPGVEQYKGNGTYHRKRDVEDIDEIDLEKEYSAQHLINILRARTFAPYKGAYFKSGNRKVYMRLHLEYGEED